MPLLPRPAVFPCPLPGPRPILFVLCVDPASGLSVLIPDIKLFLGNPFPSSQRRGGCAEGADGVVRPAKCFCRTDHPGAPAISCRATPPLRGGECEHSRTEF